MFRGLFNQLSMLNMRSDDITVNNIIIIIIITNILILLYSWHFGSSVNIKINKESKWFIHIGQFRYNSV
jgi:hypothetical protein